MNGSVRFKFKEDEGNKKWRRRYTTFSTAFRKGGDFNLSLLMLKERASIRERHKIKVALEFKTLIVDFLTSVSVQHQIQSIQKSTRVCELFGFKKFKTY